MVCNMVLRIIVGVTGLVSFLASTAFFASKPAQPSLREAVGPAGILERRLLHGRDRDTAQEITLRTSVGHLYRDQGLYSKAAEQYEAVKLLATKLGSDRLVAALRDAASADFHRGRLLQAQRGLEEALKLSGETGEEAATVLRALGNVRREQGHLDEALETYARAGRAARASGAPGTKLVSAALQAEIGEALARRGDFEHAGEHLRAAVQLQEQLGSSLGRSPEVDLELAAMRSSLGSVYQWQGDQARALMLYKQAWRTQNATLRADHPNLVATRLGHALALRNSGDMADALRALDSLEKAVRQGTLEGPDLSRVLVARADVLRENGALEQALAAATEACAVQKDVFGDEVNPEVAEAHNILGSVLQDKGLVSDALQPYFLALDISLRAGGELHPLTAAAHNSLGTAYAELEEDNAAEEHYRACLKIQQQIMPVDSAEIATSYNNVAGVLYRRGARLEASELLRRALAVMDRAKVPAMNSERLFYEHSLQRVLQELELETPKLSETPGSNVAQEAASHSLMDSVDDGPSSFAIV